MIYLYQNDMEKIKSDGRSYLTVLSDEKSDQILIQKEKNDGSPKIS